MANMSPIRAVFENGVFRPIGPVELPERCLVEFEPEIVEPCVSAGEALAGVYEVLSRRHETEEPELAASHNEHQP